MLSLFRRRRQRQHRKHHHLLPQSPCPVCRLENQRLSMTQQHPQLNSHFLTDGTRPVAGRSKMMKKWLGLFSANQRGE